MDRALGLGAYPEARAQSWIVVRKDGLTPGLPLSARETVAVLTWHCKAISLMVSIDFAMLPPSYERHVSPN